MLPQAVMLVLNFLVAPSSLVRLPAPRRCPAAALSGTSKFGTADYWREMYTASDDEAEAFSWYTGWEELSPFWEELCPARSSRVLLPGVGNDAAMVGLYDAGWQNVVAFDYVQEGVDRAKNLFGSREVELLVADARRLPFDDGSFDAALEKGALDAIFLAGGDSLQRAVDELARCVRPGGVVVSLTGFLDKVSAAFADDTRWRCARDGSVHVTEDGSASNSMNAYLLAWERL